MEDKVIQLGIARSTRKIDCEISPSKPQDGVSGNTPEESLVSKTPMVRSRRKQRITVIRDDDGEDVR